MLKNTTILTASSYLAMFFLGIGVTIVGAAARNIGLTPYQIGILLAVQNLGFIIAVLLAGSISDVLDKTKILLIGSIILAVSFMFFYRTTNFFQNLLIMFFIGTGIGAYEGVTDALLLDIHVTKQARYINVNHFFVNFGSLMITLYLIFLEVQWRQSLVQSGIAVSLLAILFGLSKMNRTAQTQKNLFARFRFITDEGAIWLLFVLTIFAVGIETGTVGILTTFLMEMRGFTQATSKIGLIVFVSGVASGRVLLGYITPHKRIIQIMLILLGSAVLLFGMLYVINLGTATYIVTFFSGVTISALLPLIITTAGLLYPSVSGTALGIIKAAIPIGGICIPLLLSLISKLYSFPLSLLLFPALGFVAFMILLTYRKRIALG